MLVTCEFPQNMWGCGEEDNTCPQSLAAGEPAGRVCFMLKVGSHTQLKRQLMLGELMIACPQRRGPSMASKPNLLKLCERVLILPPSTQRWVSFLDNDFLEKLSW